MVGSIDARLLVCGRVTTHAAAGPLQHRYIEPGVAGFDMSLRKFMIERDIPAVGSLEREQLRAAAAKSNEVLKELGPDIQWQESFVAADKTFCVYLARDEAIVRKRAAMRGFSPSKITEIRKMIDPTTERAD